MRGIGKSIFDFLLYTSLYMAFCAMMMTWQTNAIFDLKYLRADYFLFVMSATLSSYNFHWYLTPWSPSVSRRIGWTEQHRKWLLFLFMVSAVTCTFFFIPLKAHWWQIGIAVIATFIYSAPKIPRPRFRWLQRIAYGKTFFLAFVWMYVTSMLPILMADQEWTMKHTLFCMSRFFLIYAICILFDFRDLEEDKKQGIRNLIIFFKDGSVPYLFGISLLLFSFATAGLLYFGFSVKLVLIILFPGVLAALLYPYATRHFSDYLYYFVLDGFMMLSSLLSVFLPI